MSGTCSAFVLCRAHADGLPVATPCPSPNPPPMPLPGFGLTLADQHYVSLDLAMVIQIARSLPAEARGAYLRRWSCTGPHKSGKVTLDDGAVAEILARLEAA